MYITKHYSTSSSGTKHRSVLLRESYREGGKVKNRTLANLKNLPDDAIQAIEMALKHKDDLAALKTAQLSALEIIHGKSVGDLLALKHVATELGIIDALGADFQGKLALWQVMARTIAQGSRLSSVRLAANNHDPATVLELRRGFDENDLYSNLSWLAEHQSSIEDKLFHKRYSSDKKPSIFLYDVTSSYFEGSHNELAEFGYNRDKKKGKKQIVIGLLCDQYGDPLSTQVFKGNTQDPSTVADQVRKVAGRFGCTEVTFVGDRGMIKKGQIDILHEVGFHYITCITKPQIEKLLGEGLLKMELFDINICEVIDEANRYILRRNPVRARELEINRKEKQESIQKALKNENEYLKTHPKAKPETALKRVSAKIKRCKCHNWLVVIEQERILSLSIDQEALLEESRLDGCYVVKTDTTKDNVAAQEVHDRYKDLALVEWAFRTEKTTHLDVRPIYVRREMNTYGHVFVVMLSYMIVRHLARAWNTINLTVKEGLAMLSTVCAQEIHLPGREVQMYIPTPVGRLRELVNCLGLQFPKHLERVEVSIRTCKTVRKSARNAARVGCVES
jgi:transposase